MATRRPPVIAYLLGVVVLPLVALGSLLLVQVRSLQSTNDLARRFQTEVESGAAWVELRVAVQDERLFVQALATTKDLGVPVSLVTTLTGVDFEAEAVFARERTDEALASVDVSDLTGELADLERARADGASRDIVRAAYDALEQAGSVEVTARQAAVRAASAGLPLADGVHSDLDALWGLEDYSSQVRRQLNALFAYLSATSPDQQRAAQDRLVVAEAETQAIRAELTITAPSWARRLDEVESRPSVQLIERQITMTLASQTAETIDLDDLQQLGELFVAFEERHDGIAALFTDAALAVRAEAATIGDDAVASRRHWAMIGSAVLVASVALAAAAATFIRSPLRRLEQVAVDLGHGRLDTTVHVRSGPREVGVVGAALNQAIASLQAVAQRADQLVGGRGSTAEADRTGTVAGPLGEAVEATLATLERSWQEQAELRAQLAHAATHDALTGLTNRTALSHHLRRLLEDWPTDERECGILFIDLDGFKQVNDQLGHAAGDAVLIEVAARLRRACRATDLVARIGGDEFVFVLSKPTHREDIYHVAERILASLSEPYDIADNLTPVGASIGVAISTGTQDPDELLRHADEALYRAKARGRGCIHYEDHRTASGDHR